MTGPAPGPTRRRGTLLLADISGYTRFLQGVADAHHSLIVEADEPPPAYALMSHLLDTIVAALSPTFRLAKLEGDAVFAVKDDQTAGDAERGHAVLDCLHRCHAAFAGQLAAAGSQWMCTCEACARIGELDLKFVVHHGTWVAQRIAGSEELLGPDVNLAHRLLKNHAQDVIGLVPYALITDAALAELAIPSTGMLRTEEAYDGAPPVGVHILALGSGAPAPA